MDTGDLIKVYNVLSEEECEDIIEWFWEVEDRHVDGAVYGAPTEVRQNHVTKDVKDTRQVYPVPDDRVSDILSKGYFEIFDRPCHVVLWFLVRFQNTKGSELCLDLWRNFWFFITDL